MRVKTADSKTHECQTDYRIAIDLRNKMASPRGVDLIPQSPNCGQLRQYYKFDDLSIRYNLQRRT